RVAERTADPQEQATWLELAAGLLGQTAEGASWRADAQVRAVSVAPSSDTLVGLSAALSTLLVHEPEQIERRRQEFEQLVDRVLSRAVGPQRAEVALAVANLAANTFRSGATLARALTVAVDNNGPVDVPEGSEHW